MTAVAPTGMGPFEFTNSSGSQVSIPLTAFTFDASGNLVVNPNWTTVANAAPASALLTYLRAQGLLVPAPAASPKPAAIIKAVDPGPGGNNIVITIANITPSSNGDPTKTTFDITVTEMESYTGLTMATLTGIVGTSSGSGSKPGLVYVKSVANPTGLPATLASTPLTGGGAGVKAHLGINDGAAALVFTLEARDPGADGSLIHIAITAGGSTFDMTAQWTQTVTGVKIATFQSLVTAHLGYEITAAAPAGGVFSVPTALTTQLSGGAGSVNASAILVASQ